MAYRFTQNPELDHCIWSETIELKNTTIRLRVMSYNGHAGKLEIQRDYYGHKVGLHGNKPIWRPIGRMTKVEADLVVCAIKRLLDKPWALISETYGGPIP